MSSEIERALMEQRLPSQLTAEERELAELHIRRARVQLLLHFPFLGFPLSNLLANVIWVGDHQQPSRGRPITTLATDGRNLYCYAPFLMHITDSKLAMGLVLHELFHVILLHPQRAEGYDPTLANIAMDYAVNLWVNDTAREVAKIPRDIPLSTQDHLGRMPWYIPPDYFFYNEEFRRPNGDPMLWEEIYQRLLEQQRSGDGPGIPLVIDGGDGDAREMSGRRLVDNHDVWLPDQRPADAEGNVDRRPFSPREVNDGLRRAQVVLQETDLAGNVPGSLRRLIDQMIHPPLPWNRLLQNYLTFRPGDYGWAPGDLRFADPMPWPIPQAELDDIILAIDTSGSMGEDEVAAAIAQCQHILRSYPTMRGWVLMCDADVSSFAPIAEALAKPERCGYGGTSFRPPFRFLHRLATEPTADERARYKLGNQPLRPKVVVYFTDGYGDFPDPDDPNDHVDCDVIWVITNQEVQPPSHQRFLHTRIDLRQLRRAA